MRSPDCCARSSAVALRGRDQPQLLDLGRVQLVRKLVHVGRQLPELGRQAPGPRPSLNVGLAAPEQLHLHREDRQPLVDVVVQVARNPSPFIFLRGNQTAGEVLILLVARSQRRLAVAQFCLGVLALGDIEAGADVPREGAGGGKTRDA